uniref:transporter n=2 Tax=Pseudomonadota TaxID=1224 RepID=UPI0013D3DC55
VLGADYGVEAIVPLVRTSLTINAAGIADSRSGVGDVYVGPLVLGWHGAQWDAVAAAGMWLDSGNTDHPASAGKGFK